MKNQVSTKLFKINWRYLLDNALKPEFWNKTWVIFSVDGVDIQVKLYSINFRHNIVNLTVTSNKISFWESSTVEIPLSGEHFNTTVFDKKIYSACRSVLRNIEYNDISNTAQYKLLDSMDQDIKDDMEAKITEEIMEEFGLSGKLSKYQQEAVDRAVSSRIYDEYTSRAAEYMQELLYSYHKEYYGLLALTLGTEEDYQSWLSAYGTTKVEELIAELAEKFDIEDME